MLIYVAKLTLNEYKHVNSTFYVTFEWGTTFVCFTSYQSVNDNSGSFEQIGANWFVFVLN